MLIDPSLDYAPTHNAPPLLGHLPGYGAACFVDLPAREIAALRSSYISGVKSEGLGQVSSSSCKLFCQLFHSLRILHTCFWCVVSSLDISPLLQGVCVAAVPYDDLTSSKSLQNTPCFPLHYPSN